MLAMWILFDGIRSRKMAKKKYKIKIDGLEMTSSDSWDLKEIETACTLAALYERQAGHLAVYDKFMNISMNISRQLSEQMGAGE